MPTPRGAPTYDFAKLSQKLHEIERIWTRGGARVPRARLRSATVLECFLVKFIFIPSGINAISSVSVVSASTTLFYQYINII